MIKKTLILPVLAAAAVAAGCGSGSSGGTTSYGDTAPAPAAKTAAPAKTADAGGAQAPADSAAGAATKVDIANFAFAPNDIKVKVGDTVTFTNQDSAAHTATATEGASFDSGSLDQGKSFSYTAKKAGTIKFVCSFHPNMTGTITVS